MLWLAEEAGNGDVVRPGASRRKRLIFILALFVLAVGVLFIGERIIIAYQDYEPRVRVVEGIDWSAEFRADVSRHMVDQKTCTISSPSSYKRFDVLFSVTASGNYPECTVIMSVNGLRDGRGKEVPSGDIRFTANYTGNPEKPIAWHCTTSNLTDWVPKACRN